MTPRTTSRRTVGRAAAIAALAGAVMLPATVLAQATRPPAPQTQAPQTQAPQTQAPQTQAPPTAPAAAPCRNTGSFESWRTRFEQEAIQQGISRAAVAAAAPYLVYDPRIVGIDRGQRFFAQSFLQFSDKMLPAYRLQKGAEMIGRHAALFARADKEFGVPAAAEMIGSWAGELGQTQMMPSEYLAHAIDWDGDGHRNLLKSVPDVIGSTAKYLVDLGWRRGEPWLREVRVPAALPWDQADLAIQHPHAQWTAWGVTLRDGKPLPAGGPAASLLLPMGRLGPAFLAYPNFQVYLKWNASLVYATTAAYYATRLAGAPPLNRGAATIPALGQEEAKELQQLLNRAGFEVGVPDGKIGAGTRAAVKQAQMRLGLPADSYPTPELIAQLVARLRAGR